MRRVAAGTRAAKRLTSGRRKSQRYFKLLMCNGSAKRRQRWKHRV